MGRGEEGRGGGKGERRGEGEGGKGEGGGRRGGRGERRGEGRGGDRIGRVGTGVSGLVKMAWAGLDCFETAAQTGYSTDKEKEATKLHNLLEVTPLLVELLGKKKESSFPELSNTLLRYTASGNLLGSEVMFSFVSCFYFVFMPRLFTLLSFIIG